MSHAKNRPCLTRNDGDRVLIAIVASSLLVTCADQARGPVPESARRALGTPPASEVATWVKAGTTDSPDGRFLQAVAFDEKREVVLMFGGESPDGPDAKPACSQELWEWSLATGKWSRRIGTGTPPRARAGAGLVYDATGDRFVLFGGRPSDGTNLADTWEWDPTSGAWTDRTGTGAHPPARGQHGMVFQKSTGKVLLFGGGTSNAKTNDGTSVSVSMKDTWEYDPSTHAWTDRSAATGPGARHDFGMVWDSTNNRAVLFGGQQINQEGATPVPKQDVWEWDPTGSGSWTERTAEGTKPSPRFGHALTYEGSRKKILMFGGWNIDTSYARNDLWEWDPTAYTWTQRLSGSEAGVPSQRMYATLVADNDKGRLELVGGAVSASGMGVFVAGKFYAEGSNEVWDLEPVAAAFKDRTTRQSVPSPRSRQLMAYNPSTHKTYLFGGFDSTSSSGQMNDLWEWDGTTWSQVITDLSPPAVQNPAMAYDPVRKSLILYGGSKSGAIYAESTTWEWSGTTRQWSRLAPATSPGPAAGHAMVTDTTRGKVLLFGAADDKVWEWDGGTQTWTSRTTVSLQLAPTSFYDSYLAYDEGRQRVFLLYQGDKASPTSASPSAFWEWNPESAGWQLRDPGDQLEYSDRAAAYDSLRRRIVMFAADYQGNTTTYELDSQGPTWYERTSTTTPRARSEARMVFDSDRGVMVLFGGVVQNPIAINDTWEYQVTQLANGAACSAGSATACASGNCVDGVCCDVAACTGACKACNVAGAAGTCTLAAAGTEVAGSCEAGKACDGAGACKSKNGQPCTGSTSCASGFCVGGICCDSGCTGTCVSCSLAGREGRCSPQPAGTDPKNECTTGAGVCKATCDGVGACGFPAETVYCDACNTCDGRGQCAKPDPNCNGAGGFPQPGKGGAGGSTSGAGGVGGGGAGGSAPPKSSGGAPGSDGSGGAAGAGGSAAAGGGGGATAAGGSATAGSSGGKPGSGGVSARSGGTPGSGGMAGGGGSGGAGHPGQGGSARDAGGSGQADAGLTAKIQRGGCSCDVGTTSGSGPLLAIVLACAALWVRRPRPRCRRGTKLASGCSPDSRKQGAR